MNENGVTTIDRITEHGGYRNNIYALILACSSIYTATLFLLVSTYVQSNKCPVSKSFVEGQFLT